MALPFQTIETVNESAQDRLRTLELFAQGGQTERRDQLIRSDKESILPFRRETKVAANCDLKQYRG